MFDAPGKLYILSTAERLWQRRSWLSAAAVALPGALAVLLAAYVFLDRLGGEQIREPLTWDEILTVENYTWATFRSNGVPTHARRVEDLLHADRPNGMQLVAGLYRAVSVWREPNDHIVNSVLVNLSTALVTGSEAAVRFPAWIGALVFAVAIGVVAWRNGQRLAWPLALLIAAYWPYVHLYSQQARGYSWMLALQMLLLLLASDVLARRSASIFWGTLCAVVALLTFWNMVSLAVDWLFPVYLALWLYPPFKVQADGGAPAALGAAERAAYRRNLLLQGLALAAMMALFLIHFLPYVLLATQEYGIPARGLEFAWRLGDVLRYLFPNFLWALVGCAGAVGWYFMWQEPHRRPLAAVCIFTAGISLLHFLATGKLPFERTCGYLLPLVTLGATHLAELGLRRIAPHLRPFAATAAVAACGVLMLTQHQGLRGMQSEFVGYKQALEREFVNQQPYLSTADQHQGWARLRHAPARYVTALDDVGRIAAADSLAFLVVPGEKQSQSWGGAGNWPTLALPDRKLRYARALTRDALDDRVPAAFPALVVWVPNPDRREIRNELLRAAFEGLALDTQLNRRSLLAKWEFVNQVHAIEILLRNPADHRNALIALRRGRDTLGGSAVLIEPIAEGSTR